MRFEPYARSIMIAAGQRFSQRMELWAMVHVRQMRHFMRHQRATHKIGGHNQPPAITDLPCCITAAPAGARVANANGGADKARRLRYLRCAIRKIGQRARAKPAPNARANALFQPAKVQLVGIERHGARPSFGPIDQQRRIAPWQQCSGPNQYGERLFGQLRSDPRLLLLCPMLRRFARSARWQGQKQRAAQRIIPQAKRAGTWVRAQYDADLLVINADTKIKCYVRQGDSLAGRRRPR